MDLPIEARMQVALPEYGAEQVDVVAVVNSRN